MNTDETLIRHLYDRFNARDVDAVLACLADDVAWANGMEGTHVHGREAVRAYWTHQWSVIDPRVEPAEMVQEPDGVTVVTVRQTVRDLDGQLLLDGPVTHAFAVEAGFVTRFDIRGDSPLTTIHPAT